MGSRKRNEFQLYSAVLLVMSLLGFKLFYSSMVESKHGMSLIAGLVALTLLLLCVLCKAISRNNPADSHTLKSIILQYIISSAMCLYGRRVVNNLLQKTNHVQEQQEKLLMAILQKNEQTQYGMKFNFSEIVSRRQYTSKLPLVVYSDLEPYVRHIMDGKHQILTADKVIYLAETSGTTGKSKIIPITADMKGPTARKVGPLMYRMLQTSGKLDLQRVFILSYRPKITIVKGCNLVRGPVSYHMSRYVPFSIAPREAYELQYEQTALHVHAVFALKEREVGHIEALMTTLVYSFWLYLEHEWQSVCDDIEFGTIGISHGVHPDDSQLLEMLRMHLKPDPIRAEELRLHFSDGLHNIAKRIWPGLRFTRMLTTGAFANHAKILRNHYMFGVKQISQAHAASEGFLGFNLSSSPNSSLYTAMIDYGFMEFILESDADKEQPQTYFAEELMIGKCYEMVLTTRMGLYRYRTGDVVKIMQFTNQCPVYLFQYRLGQLLNLFWEKTPESVFFYAVEKALSQFKNISLVDYTVTEDVHVKNITASSSNKKRYVMFIEVQGQDEVCPKLYPDELLKFDEELTSCFEMYKTFRDNGSIGPIECYQLKRDSFRELKALIISETQTQQYKVPRVIREKKFLNFLWQNRLKD